MWYCAQLGAVEKARPTDPFKLARPVATLHSILQVCSASFTTAQLSLEAHLAVICHWDGTIAELLVVTDAPIKGAGMQQHLSR